MVFVRAKSGPPNIGDPPSMFTVQYFDEQGNMIIRSGGKRTWRCNNPGALLKSPYSMSKDSRAIGSAGFGEYEYAVYPDYETGHEALVVMLRGSHYRNLTLLEASIRYVKEDPGHGPKIAKMSNLNPNRKISSLVGEEDFIPKWIISGVHKKRGVITEYLVYIDKESIWLPKQDAIQWTLEGKLHAVLVHMKNGNYYLRPQYGQHGFVIIT